MEFVLLGTGHETVPLIQALTASAEHHLRAFAGPDSLAWQVGTLAPGARRLAHAADALNVPGVDAVVIDAVDADTLEVAKQFAGNGVALLLYPRAAHGIEFIYQLGLIRDEQPDQFRLYPIRPWRLHPLILKLRAVLQRQELGRVHQIQWNRESHVEGPVSGATPTSMPALLSQAQIDAELLNDADLLKFLAGEFDQVSATQTGDVTAGFIQASVNLGGAQSAPAQWTCRGTFGAAAWELTVRGELGQIGLKGGNDWATVSWESKLAGGGNLEHPVETVTADYGPGLLREFLDGNTTTAATNGWADDLNRDFDLLEGAHRSLRRRRTVELYFDTPSERSNFKTQMTAVGCGVLLLTLLAMLGGLGAGLVVDELQLPPIIMQVVRVLVFLPLFLFLALQVGIFLSKPSAATKPKTNQL